MYFPLGVLNTTPVREPEGGGGFPVVEWVRIHLCVGGCIHTLGAREVTPWSA